MIKPRVQFRLRISRGTDIAIGPGKIDLLEAIEAAGSISAAARSLGMSYRRGGARLTRLGAEVIERYRRIERNAARAGATDLRALARRVKG